MTDKVQKIKEEIERRILQCYKCLAQDLLERERNETNCRLQQYKELLQFIDSLSEEPSVKGITWKDVNTLDTLINQVRYEFPNGIGEKSFGLAVLEKFQDYQDDIEEPASEDLEEEIDRYYSDWQFDDDTIYEDMRDICRHFAEWQKQQMIKGVINAEVLTNFDYRYLLPEVSTSIFDTFKTGDKVKLIVIKEGNQ